MGNFVIGIDLGGTNIKAGIVDRKGTVIHRLSTKTNYNADSQTIINQIFKLIDEIIQNACIKKADVIGIGLGSPGLIDKKGEIIIFSPNLPQWRNVPIKLLITENFDKPCVLENDANAAALGEKLVGAGKNSNSLVMLTIGTGIGGGIIIDNKLWRGVNNVAAEIGHMVIKMDGLKCSCGNNGCIEAYASATAMVRRFKKLLKKGVSSLLENSDEITAKMISDAALQGDKAALNVIRETGQFLGIAVVNIMHILNPALIVLSGGMIGSGDLLMNPIKETVKKSAFESSYKETNILFSELGNDVGIIGAAGCLLKELEISV